MELNPQPPYYQPVETAKSRGFTKDEEEKVRQNRKRMIIGTPTLVKEEIQSITEAYETDEIMIVPIVSGIEN